MADQTQDPIALFQAWLVEAELREPGEPTAMTLATVAADGTPSARLVLLKGADHTGFVFYTNVDSRKGADLDATGRAALVFHWQVLRRQVRIEGMAERVSDAEADAYFASRERGSQIGAWASDQSRADARPVRARKAGRPLRREIRPRHGAPAVALDRLSGGAPSDRVLAQPAFPAA